MLKYWENNYNLRTTSHYFAILCCPDPYQSIPVGHTIAPHEIRKPQQKPKFSSRGITPLPREPFLTNRSFWFEKLFGSPQEAVVCIGGWEQKQHRKFKEPVKGKGFRTLFRKAGYKVFLVDEFRTSRRCSEHGVCSTFRKCDNPRPYRQGRILRHGLVKCSTCSRLWNRDVNAASNIWKVAKNAILGLPRPDYLQRAQ